MGQFTRRPMDTGFSQTPHGLWTMEEVKPGARLLLGWLHSHSDQYLASVTESMVRRMFNTSTVTKWLDELEGAGYLVITRPGPRKANSYELLVEPWIALHKRRRHRAEIGPANYAGTGLDAEPESAHVVQQGEHQEEHRSLRSRAAADSGTARDALFAAICDVTGMAYEDMPTRARRQVGIVVSELMKLDPPATPEEVQRRARIYGLRFTSALTAQALLNQWPFLREEPAAPPPKRSAQEEMLERVMAKHEDNVVPINRSGT